MKFLAAQPGCWIQYYDDTEAKDPAKARSARKFDPAVARRKQTECCAVCYSLQAFGESRTKSGLLVYRKLGVDVDLVAASERRSTSPEEIDRRKDEYLARYLLTFPLKPHWLVETRHGFHIVFRLMPIRKEPDISEALAVNRTLVVALRGDENAVLLTQVLRVPGTLQFKAPGTPFLCRLLLDNSSVIPPYELAAVRSVLDAIEVFHGKATQSGQDTGNPDPSRRGHEGLNGVPEGQRNATAASIVGGILCRLPEHLWETAGWGGLKEWNGRNALSLAERELRTVFESIARRERTKRGSSGQPSQPPECRETVVRVEVRIGPLSAAQPHSLPSSGPQTAHFPPHAR